MRRGNFFGKESRAEGAAIRKMEDFNKFCEEMLVRVRDVLGEENFTFSLHTAHKNNGVELTGIMAMPKSGNVAPTLYLNSFYGGYVAGEDLDSLAKEVVDCLKESFPRKEVSADFFTDYEKVRNSIGFRLVNREKNVERHEEALTVPFLDMAVELYVQVPDFGLGEGTVLVMKKHAEWWGVTAEELMARALENAPRCQKLKTIPLVDLLIGAIRDDKKISRQEKEDVVELLSDKKKSCPILLLSVEGDYGAGCVLYPGVLQETAERLGGSFYLTFPSTEYGVAVREGCTEGEDLLVANGFAKSLAQDVSYLSDSTYRYDASSGLLSVVGREDLKACMGNGATVQA